MISVGSSIKLFEIKKIFKNPKKIWIGLLLQVIALPLIAIIIAIFAPISVYYKIGIVILAACPGGAMSNFISYLIKADVPLSVGLTSTNSFITIFTIPVYVAISYFIFFGNFVSIKLPIIPIISKILLMVILPVIIGISLRERNERIIIRFEKSLKIISTFLLLIIFLIKFFANSSMGGSGLSFDVILLLFPYLFILNIMGLFIGYDVSIKAKLSKRTAITMGIEVGLQNTVLTLLITDVILKNTQLGYPALVYAMFSFISTLLFGFFMSKSHLIRKIRPYFYSLIYER